MIERDAAVLRDVAAVLPNALFEREPADPALRPDPDWFSHVPDRLWLKSEAAAAADAAVIARAMALVPGEALLDCPCGDGRVGVHLARRGLCVTGVDINTRFIAKARERFQECGLEADLRQGDMRALPDSDAFEDVLSWSNSFGYFGIEDDFATLIHLARALRPGGRMLLEAPNRVGDAKHIPTKYDAAGHPLVVCWDACAERIVWQETLAGLEGERPCISGVRLYSLAQYQLLFRLAGLEPIQVWGEDLSPHGEASKRMLLLARKPAALR